MAKKKHGSLPIFIVGLAAGAVVMYIGKDKLKGLVNKAENLGAARARRIAMANRARRAGYVV